MTERERELIATIWFLALMAVILLVLVSINAGGGEEPISESTSTICITGESP